MRKFIDEEVYEDAQVRNSVSYAFKFSIPFIGTRRGWEASERPYCAEIRVSWIHDANLRIVLTVFAFLVT